MEYWQFILGGITAGAIAGFLPGIGNVVVLVLLFPFFLNTDPIGLILFYACMSSIGQFTGSVTSTVMGVPGELSSLPAAKEGHRLYLRGQGTLALSQTALGSAFGSLIAIGFVFLISGELDQYAFLYSTWIQSIVLILVLSVIAVHAGNNKLTNCLLIATGYALAMVGVNSLDDTQSITFGIPDLTLGIPLFPVIVCLYVLPQMLRNLDKYKLTINTVVPVNISLLTHITTFISNICSSLRGTVLGFFLGLIPYLTTIVSSNVSYFIETKIRQKKKIYNTNGDVASLTSAETANNSAALSSLLPLLVIGIPITTSEAILLELVNANGFAFAVDNFADLFFIVAVTLVFANLVGVLLSWPLSNLITLWYKIPLTKVYFGVIILCVSIIVFLGVNQNALMLYICSSGVLALAGYCLRRVDTMPLVFAFVMQDAVENNLTRLIFYML